MKKKYIFFDIDGTLTALCDNRSYIPESNKQAVKLLQANGFQVAIASGREHLAVRPVMDELGIEDAVTDGGNGLIYRNKLLYCDPLERDVCDRLITELLTKKIAFAVMDNPAVHELKASEEMMQKRKLLSFEDIPVRIVEHFNPFQEPCYKFFIELYEGEEDRITSIDTSVINRWCFDNLVFEPSDKCKGIRKLLEIYGGTTDDAVIFGDGLNDIPMFREIPFSIAMGNGEERLKQIAYYVTDASDQDGIIHACRHFGWI